MGRTYDESKIYNGGKVIPHVVQGNAGNTVEGPASIAELVRALQNNPQYIYEWVYNNIDWEPGWGLNNGAFGTILAGRGNAFEQTCLLVTLLEAAGYTANYVLGTIQLNAAAAGAWFGTDPTSSNEDYCFYNEIPVQYVLNPVTGQYDLQLSHVWVQCVISGTTYLFDPSYKTYTRKTAVANLGTILGYNSSTFYSSAETGATIDPSGNFVKNMNDTNIRSNLATMAGNLATWIQANNPTAGISDILGGSSIVPVTLPVLNTTLPYIVSGATQTVWTGTSGIPLAYKTTLALAWTDADITQTFTTDQLAGGRLTIWWSGTTPTLYLNGTVVEAGSAVEYTETYPTVTITHNAYSTFDENNENYFYLITGELALIGSVYNNQGRGIVDYHQAQIAINTAAGNAAGSEPVLGETLALLWANYQSETSAIYDIADRFFHTKTTFYASYACVAWTGSTPRIDQRVGNATAVGLDSSAPSGTDRALGAVQGLLGNALERCIFEQVTGTIPSINSNEMLRVANNAGTVIYQGTSANWSGTVSPALTAAGYTTAQISEMYDDFVSNNYVIEVPDNPATVIGNVNGYGYNAWPTNNNGGPAGEIYLFSGGGFGGATQTPGQVVDNGAYNRVRPMRHVVAP
jgi:hypothetical protein